MLDLLSCPIIQGMPNTQPQNQMNTQPTLFQKLQVRSISSLQKLTTKLGQVSLDHNRLEKIENEAFKQDFKLESIQAKHEEIDISTNDAQSIKSIQDNNQRIGLYTKQERANKIQKYKEKIRMYREAHPISKNFQGRSTVAGKKPRIKGKFVTNEEFEKHRKYSNLEQNESDCDSKQRKKNEVNSIQQQTGSMEIEQEKITLVKSIKLNENAEKLKSLPLLVKTQNSLSNKNNGNEVYDNNFQNYQNHQISNNVRNTNFLTAPLYNLQKQMQIMQLNSNMKQFYTPQKKEAFTHQLAVQNLLTQFIKQQNMQQSQQQQSQQNSQLFSHLDSNFIASLLQTFIQKQQQNGFTNLDPNMN